VVDCAVWRSLQAARGDAVRNSLVAFLADKPLLFRVRLASTPEKRARSGSHVH
jgi:hypothetical protein